MNKLIALLAGLSLLASTRAEEIAPPPTQPILPRATDRAEWSLVAKFDKEQKAPGYRILMQMTVTKGAKVRRIVSRWSDGQTTERWVVDSLVLSEEPDGRGIQVYDSSQPWVLPSPPPFPNYGSSDFPELSWISMGNYAGVGSYLGRTCYVFQRTASVPKNNAKESELNRVGLAMDRAAAAQVQSVDKERTAPAVTTATPAPDAKSPVVHVVETAFLDVKTQLPVAVTGAQVTREYVFSSQTPAEPMLTPRFADLVRSTQEALAAPYRKK